MQIVNIYQAKTNLSDLVDRVVAGEEVVIARNNRPLVTLSPYQKLTKPREFGPLKGQIKIAKDFDAVDREIEKMFYGEG